MEQTLIAFIAIVAALAVPRVMPDALVGWRRAAAIGAMRLAFGLIALYEILSTSIISIPANQVGIIRKIYGFTNIAPGHIIATHGETGYQAEIIPPGTFRISILFNVLNKVDLLPVVTVPSGFYGRIVASDGEPLSAGQIMADAWPDADQQKFLDAEYFMSHGQKGLQLSVLKPGVYPLNLALFQVKIGYIKNGRDITVDTDDVYDLRGKTSETTPLDTSITRVPAGSVGVVRSSVQTAGVDCKPRTAKTDNGGLTAELVTQYCKGVWDRSLPPNDYYLNRDAYDVTLVSPRVYAFGVKGRFPPPLYRPQGRRPRRFYPDRAHGELSAAARRRGHRDQHQDRGVGNPAGAARDRSDHAGKRPDRRCCGRRSGRGRPAHRRAFDSLARPQRLRRLHHGARNRRGRDDPASHATHPRARHDRKPRRVGAGDPRAGADRRTARGRRHQGDPARRIGDPAGIAAGAPARATGRAASRRLCSGADRPRAAAEDRAGPLHRRPATRPRHRADLGADRASRAGWAAGRRPRRAALSGRAGGRPDRTGQRARQRQCAATATIETDARPARLAPRNRRQPQTAPGLCRWRRPP